ncbi:hypothetical protein [Arthrobacter sp. zg-Y844]|uniref:hypothetical protein n=1 Tax=Arthrobacter sp. zg-Y844 TaxID=2964612 RepID=UPI00210750FF|nr:hypothetical protein [Arthrobacter sp. zg-Y844]MCQ1988053.1 hypothetical protein [Arthrobacter sp. zg-Y844]
MTFKVLWARYRVHGLNVSIGWTVGHIMGDFREPNKLRIDFDASDYALAQAGETGTDTYAPAKALDGITTSLLRAIPMAHARALMRERHEQLTVGGLRQELSPLPSRVESDRDYVHISMAYVALVNGSSVEPIKRLAEWTGESVDTWSARLRRARTKGILLGTGRKARIAPEHQAVANDLWNERRAENGRSSGDQ